MMSLVGSETESVASKVASNKIPSAVTSDTDMEPFVFNESHHSARLLAGLRHLQECSQLFDVTLVAEGQEFPAHRVVLASCSDYFHAMFTNGLKESSQQSVLLTGVTASAMEQLIHFAYTSKLKITKENVLAVLSGANHVQMLPAVHACETYLCSHLTLQNCVELEHVADLYSLKKLHRKVRCFICEHWMQFMVMPDFLSLSQEQLEGILRSNFPVYCPEVEVVQAILAWLHHDLAQRASFLVDLLALVKPENLAPPDIQQLLVSPLGQNVSAACQKLEPLLSGLAAMDTKTVPGVVNTRGYFETVLLAGGFHQVSESGMSNDMMYLDPDCQKPVPYTSIPHVKQADFGLAVLNNLVYVVGGCYDDFTEMTHPYGFCFNPTTSKWTSLPPMAQERCRFYFGALNGLLYAVGGEVDNSQVLVSCEMFDPERAVWSPIAPLPGSRSELAGTSLDGKLYVSGGMQEQLDRVQNQLWCYHPETDSWCQCAPMLSPRADHSMFTYRSRIYVIGGWCKTDRDRTPVTSVDCYDAKTNRWQTVQHMKTARRYCTCTLFQDRVYVIGGGGESGMSVQKWREMDVLDLKTMQWQPDPVSLPSIWEHSTVSIHLPRKAV